MPWLLLVPTVGNKSVTPSKEKPDMVVTHHILHLQTDRTDSEKEKTQLYWLFVEWTQPFPMQCDLASFSISFFFFLRSAKELRNRVALVHSVMCFSFYCNVFLSDTPVAAGELFCAFSFRHSSQD